MILHKILSCYVKAYRYNFSLRIMSERGDFWIVVEGSGAYFEKT